MAIIKLQNNNLVIDTPLTFLASDVAAGATSLSVKNITGFSNGQTIIIGEMGDEGSEIVSINGTPSGTTLSITALTLPHINSTPVRLVLYDQVEISSAATTTGSKSVLVTTNVWADNSTTNYIDTTGTTGYYFGRFKNSISGLFSTYSDPIPVSGYADNTVWSVKHRALDQLGETLSDLITNDFLNDSLMEARRIADQNPATLRWSFRTQFGVVIGQMLAGQWSIAAPTDLRDRNTYKNILSLRMGNQNQPIVYQDRRRFNQNYLNVVHTTVATAASLSAVSLVLTSTHDLDASGTIRVANNAVGDALTTVTYSANNKTTNTLTCTALSRAISAGTDVWQRATFGVPSAYSVDNAVFYFDNPLSTTFDGQDLKGDYYKAIPTIDSDADTFDEPFYDLYVPYLKWKIKYKKANGKIDRDSDTDYKDWVTGIGQLISQEVSGQSVNFVPDIEGFLSSEG